VSNGSKATARCFLSFSCISSILEFIPEWNFWIYVIFLKLEKNRKGVFKIYSRMLFSDTCYIFKTRKNRKGKKASLSNFRARALSTVRHRYSTFLYRLYERWYVQLHVLNLVYILITPDLVLHFIKKFRNKFRAFATRGLGVTKKRKPLQLYRAKLLSII
jgi:hypothetical protein